MKKITINDMETFQKEFEKNFLPGFCELFQNGQLNTEVADFLLTDYNENYDDLFKNKELSHKTKALIALAVASAIYRPYCIEAYCNDAREYGWRDEQILEAMQVAAAIQCGFASVHSVQKLNDFAGNGNLKKGDP
ncbi:MAG TPA: carboxymuconolactone decarboxylase family protein [Chitinophagaceae bacterium]|jgi:AhpD family alkylhydroperoxidase